VGLTIDIVTIFPEYFGDPGDPGGAGGPLGASLIGKAAARGDLKFRVHDLRRWAADVHHTVDDVPFGGGPGMVMKPDVWGMALDEILGLNGPGPATAGTDPAGTDPAGTDPAGTGRLVVPTPSGVPFTQEVAARYAIQARLIFACGRYEGIDARVADHMRQRMPVDEMSIGDYVLAGGEAAVLVMLEAVARLLPGFVGNLSSVGDDSFGGTGGAMSGLLEGPVYTRPRQWRGLSVPEVLLSGNHAAIARWRRDMALRRTAQNRPDLLHPSRPLDKRDRQVLAEAGFRPPESAGGRPSPAGAD
jgi:tRNA (guanine37-N1)-methyltransferase